MNKPRSAYLHIPFCHRRCFYCDFAVVPLGDKANGEAGPGSSSIKSYLKLLHREIDLVKDHTPLSTVYIGGGTPSLLSPTQINSLLNHLRNLFGFQHGAEITLEIDPASFNQISLDAFLGIGINRLSLGGQSFDDDLLLKLGRRHSSKELIEACNWIHERYIKGDLASWNLDLIENLPGHDSDFWKSQLDQAIKTAAPHLSIYELSVEPGTVFEWRRRRGELPLPSEDTSIEISRLTTEKLREAGFARYEISNYALPGHASRHNRSYWSGSGWWGFGMGATSAPWGERLSRPRTRDKYKSWLVNQELHGIDSSLLAQNSKIISLDDQIIVGLRRREGINLEYMGKTWGWDALQCQKHINSLETRWQDSFERGWLKRQGKRIALSDPEGMEISNQVLLQMVLWWEELPSDAVVAPNC